MKKVKFSGTVVTHDKNGRKLGYPTANIEAPSNVDSGIYAGLVELHNKNYPAMIFIGQPVTLGKTTRRAETHILDFPDEDLYGLSITFTLLQFVRDNQNFDSIEALIEAIKRDEKLIRAFFAEKGYNKI